MKTEWHFFGDYYTTGIMGDEVQEQSLIIDSDEGLIVITGCAHSGILEIARKAQEILNKKIVLLLGGFHLMHEDTAQIDKVISELKKMDIALLCPIHCTGNNAIEQFKKVYKKSISRVVLAKSFKLPHQIHLCSKLHY